MPGLALSFMTGYALSLLVPLRSFINLLKRIRENKEEEPRNEPSIQQNDPYLERLVKEITQSSLPFHE